MMRTLIGLHGFTPEQEAAIREAAPGWTIHFGRTTDLDPALYREAEIICGWNGDAASESLKPEAKLRWVQTWSAGVDKLPLDLLRERGVVLTDAAGVHPGPVAETTFALMLGLSRGVHQAVRDQMSARWGKVPALPELSGMTALIVGAGAIGSRIGQLAQAFGMRTLGVRKSGGDAPGIERMVPLDKLDEALAVSDYVINVLPYTPSTHHLFDEGRFAAMKTGARFVNVGRGNTVDTDALLRALDRGQLAGAGLDVYEIEPLPPEHPLWTREDVILTPHTGGQTDRLKERIAELFADNLRRYITDGAAGLINVVDYDKGY